jgi:hypothetical protein
MIEYDVRNEFGEDTYIRVEDIDIYGNKVTPLTKIVPGSSYGVVGGKTIGVRAISGAEEVECRIGLNTDAERGYRLTLKRDGKMWQLKNLEQPFKQEELITRDTSNPKVPIDVGPNGQ